MSVDRKYFYETDDKGAITSTTKASGTGWVKTSGGLWLYSKDGAFLNGSQTVGKNKYYFNDGVMMSDVYMYGYGYYGSDGKLQTTDGWVKNDNVWFYLADKTSLTGSRYIDGKWYYLDSFADSGIKSADGAIYDYAGSSGGRTAVSFKEGWNKYNDEWYYVRNTVLVKGVQKIGSKWYNFDNDGKMSTTGTYVYYGKGYRYLKPDGTWATNEWEEVNGVQRYFGADGYVLTGFWSIDGKSYVFINSNLLGYY